MNERQTSNNGANQPTALYEPGAAPHFRARLRSTLVIVAVLLSILPVGLALSYAITRTSEQARQQVFNQLTSVTETKEQAILASLSDSQDNLRIALADPEFHQDAIFLLTDPEADDSVAMHVSGDLSAIIEAQQDYDEYFIYDTQGTIVASTDPVQVGKIVSREPYFQLSLAGEHIQPPFYAVGSAALNMVISRPLNDESGQTVGVLAGRLSLDELGDVMTQHAGLGQTGETYLVSLENSYLVTPSRFEGYPLTRSYHSEGIDQALAGVNGEGAYADYRGEPVIGVYRWLPSLQVAMLAEMDTSEALAGSRQAAQASILAAALAALAAGSFGLLAALRITRPITQLTQATRQLAEGDLTARAHVEQSNEIGELGYAFNSMAVQLQDTLGKLEESVKEARLATAMAREANRLKSEFLATMSHELRTPLNAIIGFTEIMLAGMAGPLNDKHEHKISRIHLNSKRLLGLINDLLDLAKIEAGRVDVLREPFSPSTVAAKLEAEMESLAEQRGLAFEVLIDEALPARLIGDAPRIEQAVGNLLSNAFKFTSKGGVTLKLSANGNDNWTVSVTDTGIGVPPHAIEYIFDEFRQADTGSQRAYGGSGLGLSITRNLARIMGGDVRVSSKLGEGSTFTLVLPLIVAESERLEAVR